MWFFQHLNLKIILLFLNFLFINLYYLINIIYLIKKKSMFYDQFLQVKLISTIGQGKIKNKR